MFDKLNFKLSVEDQICKERVFEQLQERYRDYKDPWGFNLAAVQKAMDIVFPIYRHYFKVRVFGAEHVKDENYMLVSNHTGQVPIDGVLITAAMAFETQYPRVVHSMIERFMSGLPFIGDLTAQTGSILGDRANCKWLLNQNESILVFPEGVRGINKSTKDFYKLQKFSQGFYRIALQTQTKILPIAVIGAEEMFPVVFQAGGIGKKFGLPSLPIPLNFFPLPSPIDIYIGEPIDLPEGLSSEAPEKDLEKHINDIEKAIKKKIEKGLADRRSFYDDIRKPINQVMKKF